jgi:SAM-dependent methyltransferase
VKAPELARHPRRWLYERARRRFAAELIKGAGIEIGALHNPFPVPADARVSFVDRLCTSRLREEYPELADRPLVDVDSVDDGEALATIADDTLDFVVASHFLEHCEDPIGALKAHLRVLRRGGVWLVALPDRRHGVDRGRDPTSLEHLLGDHEHGGARSRAEHYNDWVRLVDVPLGNVDPREVERHAAELLRRRYSIHFHCWTADEFSEQLRQVLHHFRLRARVIAERRNGHEFLVAVRRD